MPIQQMLLGGGPKPEIDGINLLFKGQHDSSGPHLGGSLTTMWSNATLNNYSDANVNNIYTQSDFSRVGDGILKFSLNAASYKIYAKSGSGSGTGSWSGMTFEGTMTIVNATNLLVLIPNHGMGNYSGGGGFYLVSGVNYSTGGNTPFLVLGGGGSGYSYANDWGKPGSFTTATNSANHPRRGPSMGTSGVYDGGGGFENNYTIEGSNANSSLRAQHFIQGGKGGNAADCGTTWGGFGGGGGPCPGGGGGFYGGYPGGNSHDGGSGYGGSQNWSGGQHGGGGGTSYYNPSYISHTMTVDYGATNSTSYATETVAQNGYFGIHTVN